MVRILHIITTLDVGGAELELLEVLRRMDRTRFQTTVAFLKGSGELSSAFEAAGVRTVSLRAADSLSVAPLQLALRLARELRPAVLHTHLGKADLLGALTAKLAAIPVLVSTKHNEDPYLKSPPVAAAARLVAEGANRIVAISKAVEGHLRRTLRLGEPRLCRIPYGLPESAEVRDEESSSTLRRELFEVPRGGRLVVCVARFTRQKGLHDLLRAASLLRDAVPRARFAIIGRGEQRRRLEDLLERLDLAPYVRLVGFRRDARAILRAADVFTLPSHWEGFGLVLLEAMAAGLPVVGTRVGAIPEVVVHGETGLLVPPGDADALAAALLELLSDPEEARRMGEAGRRRLRREFGIERAVRAHEDLYTTLLSERPR